MEVFGEVKKDPVALAVGGRLVKRKWVPSEAEQGQKRSNSTSRFSPKTKSSAKENGVVNGKRKRPMLQVAVEEEMDSEHVMNAAQALFELFGGAGGSSQKRKSGDATSPKPKAAAGGGVKWAAKKSRSSRSSKKADDCACKLSSSSTTSATVTDIPEVLDSSTSHNHHAVAAENLEEDESEADAKSTDMSPCDFGLDRGHRLLSQSSVESTLLDSRAESPSSPLRVLRPDAALIPKLEEEMLLQFGFQKQPPVRPVTTPLMLRKPKAEENCAVQLDELKEVKIALKQVQRRKPRVSNLKGQPLVLQGDVLDGPIASSATVPKECIEENKFQVPVTLNLFEPVKLETGRVKVETYQTASSTQVRLRNTLSEAEKEVRRLRRVQANRESARQTIRRKQVLCEELARKAGELQAEKDNLALSLEAKSKELRNHQEINRQLKEQILAEAETPLSSTTKVSNNIASASPAPATGPMQGMPMLPYWWAFAMAQSVAAASQSSSAPTQMGEAGAAAAALPPDFNTVFTATLAAMNSGAGLNPNMWMNMMGNMTNKTLMPGMGPALVDQNHQPTLAHSAPRPAEAASPQKPAAAEERPPQALGRTTSMPVSGHPYSSPLKVGMTSLDSMSRSQMNGKFPAGIPSSANSRVKYQLTNGAPLVRSVSGMTSQVHDGIASASTTLSLGLGSHRTNEQQQMRKPGNLRFFPTIGNGVQGYLGPRLGVYQSEAAALATEARRRRRELKRTKSLQSQLQQEKKLASVKSL